MGYGVRDMGGIQYIVSLSHTPRPISHNKNPPEVTKGFLFKYGNYLNYIAAGAEQTRQSLRCMTMSQRAARPTRT